ncbi:DUF4105 domain-containing protein [Candidatus Electronema sp. JC]|uniref:Lnb N-terminal periplasmic domain-containing protein n=1 Tax=Candidatus Electronema sp. JC TaxID=3401570 RepID=UPI003B435E75
MFLAKKIALFFFLSLLSPHPAAAALSPPPAPLARHPTWLKLLHFDRESGQSEILSPDFFLASDGRQNAEAELRATLAAYAAPWPEDGNSHARCRFPARYFWLNQQLHLPDYQPVPAQCRALARWSLPEKTQSFSLFLVSGYLGNPASVFGHSLLKLNTKAQDDQAGLFDLTVNYGALVPEDEPVALYILRGLGGGYQAGFSDRYFYTQDLVYSRTEFRDIWDYELLLTDAQRTLLVLHLWEVLGKKFAYYFLDKNCAFRLAELLELVFDEPLLERAKFWYAPVETLHRLEDLDRQRRAAGQPGLIKSVRFIPSAQRRMRHQFSLLRPEEQAAARAVIRQGPDSLQEHLAELKPERQAEVADSLLAYANYRLTAEQPEPSAAAKAMKNRLLPARFLLPPSSGPLAEPPALPSPAAGDKPMLVSLGAAYDARQQAQLRLRWAPFIQESLGRNSLAGDELAVLDTSVSLGGKEDALFLEQLDLIRIRKIKTNFMAEDGENPWSWQLRGGVAEDEGRYDALLQFGIGWAWQISPQLTAYAMTDAAAHSVEPYLRLRPQLGLLAGNGGIKGRLLAGLATVNYEGDAQPFLSAELQAGLSAQTALCISVEQAERTALTAELKWFW